MMTARLHIKNWGEFQHYKKRNPPWIKLHKKLLDDFPLILCKRFRGDPALRQQPIVFYMDQPVDETVVNSLLALRISSS